MVSTARRDARRGEWTGSAGPSPRGGSWASPLSIDEKAKRVASLFRDNFKKYEAQASTEVRAGGPKL
jgi:ATP-dependent phosphoenolpyruvate carboxykinase